MFSYSLTPYFSTLFILITRFLLTSGQCDTPMNVGLQTPIITDWAKTSYDVDEIITYECKVGHRKSSGSGESTCKSDGEWTEPNLECEPIQCGSPVKPLNGRVIGTEFTFGKGVNFECNRGFKFESKFVSKQATCMANGKWDAESPNCVAILCPVPEEVKNAQAQYNSLGVDFKVTYKCKSGFKLVGSSERTCQENATWSNSLPSCEIVKCPNPNDDKYRRQHDLDQSVIHIGIRPGHKIIFVCENGIRAEAECLETGEWSIPPPCKKGELSSTTESTFSTPIFTNIPTSVPTDLSTLKTPFSTSLTHVPIKTESPDISSTDTDIATSTSSDIDDTTSSAEESKGLPSWAIVLLAFCGSAAVITVIALLIIFLKKRKNELRTDYEKKVGKEMDSLTNENARA